MKKLIIPSRFIHVDYNKDVLPFIKDCVDNFKITKKGLYLYGTAGTGKTHTAYAICKKLSEEGQEVVVFKSTEILRIIKEEINNHNQGTIFDSSGSFGKTYSSFLEGINDFKGLLFIDDFGTEKESEWVIETFYSIIDKKYEDEIPVIITSNFKLDEINEKMGDRFASRIAQMCEIIPMVGGDRRLK